MKTNRFTEQDRYRTLLCVKYVRTELAVKRLEIDTAYQAHNHYDAEIDQKLTDLNESIAYYDELIEKLNDLMY